MPENVQDFLIVVATNHTHQRRTRQAIYGLIFLEPAPSEYVHLTSKSFGRGRGRERAGDYFTSAEPLCSPITFPPKVCVCVCVCVWRRAGSHLELDG